MPNTATISPARKVTVPADPATALIRSGSRAPQAWPTSTEAPAPSPMMKAMKKNWIGKNPATAARALTPSIWPRKMLLIVPDAAWRMLASTIGPRNRR
jgi:hypothetical protein